MSKTKRTIKGFTKTGSISRKEARAAVRDVGRTRSASTGKYASKSRD